MHVMLYFCVGFCCWYCISLSLTGNSGRLCISLSLTGNSGRLTRVWHSSRKSSATHSYLCVKYFRVSKQWYSCQCLGFLTLSQMLMHAITDEGSTDTVIRESALEAGCGPKIPSRTGDSNLRQYCAWFFSRTLY